MKLNCTNYLILVSIILFSLTEVKGQGDEYQPIALGFDINYGLVLNREVPRAERDLGVSEAGGFISYRTGYKSDVRSGLIYGSLNDNEFNIRYIKIPVSYNFYLAVLNNSKTTEAGRSKSLAGLKMGLGGYYSFNNEPVGDGSSSFRDDIKESNFGGTIEFSFSRNNSVDFYLRYSQDLTSAFGDQIEYKRREIALGLRVALFGTGAWKSIND